MLQTWNIAQSIGRSGRLRQDWRALRRSLLPIILFAGLLLAACAPAPVTSTVPQEPTATAEIAFVSEDAVTALPQLVQSERNAAAALDIATLAALWAEDARIVERRDAGDPADDYTWQGRDAILDRYQVAVFPNPPAPLDAPPDAPVMVDGENATMTNGVDAWRFIWREGRWWIAELIIG